MNHFIGPVSRGANDVIMNNPDMELNFESNKEEEAEEDARKEAATEKVMEEFEEPEKFQLLQNETQNKEVQRNEYSSPRVMKPLIVREQSGRRIQSAPITKRSNSHDVIKVR